MLKEKKNKGYILLESSLAFFITTSLILLMLPLLLFFREKQQQGRQELEVYRFFSELAENPVAANKTSGGQLLVGKVLEVGGNIQSLRIETGVTTYEVELVAEVRDEGD